MRIFCLLFGIILSCSLASAAEAVSNFNYYFTKIDGEKGLSQNNVKSIIQDSYGFMWFGTRNRLNRYDGTSIKVYDCYDPVSERGNNNIAVLYEHTDKKMWLGTDMGIFIFDPVLETFTSFNDSTSNNIYIYDWVADIKSDLDNNIWIIIPNQGLFRYNTIEKKLHHYAIGSTDLPDQGNPQCMCIEQNGMVWIGTNGGGVYLYDKKNDSFAQYLGDRNGDSLKDENIYTMCDYGDELVVGIHEGRLRKLNKRRNTLSDVNAPDVHYKIIRHLICIKDELWVGTQAGVYVINELEDKVSRIHVDLMSSFSISDNVIERIYKDREDGIWIGTNFGGVNYLPKRGMEFERFVPLNNKNSIRSKRIRELQEDKDGNIWIATEDAGLDIYNPKTNTFTKIGSGADGPLYNNSVLGFLLNDDRVWVGYFKNGLDVLQLPQMTTHHYSGKDLNLNESSIFEICEGRHNRIWIGNAWGVYLGDKSLKNFVLQDQFGLSFIYDIMEDSEGNIWAATMGNGVFKYNPKADQIEHYLNDPKNPKSLSSNSATDITETSTGEIWFSTDRGGICRYNKSQDNFTTYSVANGLPDDVAYKILEDKSRSLWFGTNNGLVRFNPLNESVRVFTKNDGLPSNQFNYKSALVSSSGKLYIGGLEGMIAFNPDQFKENTFIPPVYITKLTIFNKEVRLTTPESPLSKSIIHTDKITLDHTQSNIGFDFVALSYVASSANKYAYKMENIDEDWTYTTNNHTASYAKLPPGKYTFKVKGSNNDGVWNEAGTSIEITILPPWWQSNLAITIYLFMAIFAVYYYAYWYKKRTDKSHSEKQKLFEIEKEKELYSSKVEFFTNIAHEIRTPITLINGPLESMQEMEINDPEIKKNLNIMSKNTSSLLSLVNQLLDFRKVDSNNFLLNLSIIDISEFVSNIYNQFEQAAIHQDKEIKLTLPQSKIFAPVDTEAFTKILNNLFSNALRYSNKHIDVELFIHNSHFIIRFTNDGELIPKELGEKIFDPFYQVNKTRNANSSSGIGLSLALSLTKLHDGELYFREKDSLNEFILELPLENKKAGKIEENDEDENYILKESEIESESKTKKSNADTILIVEDNIEMQTFIADKLNEQYNIEKATNGVDALKILEKNSIGLVLTDIMMPEMDGFELCKNIKSNLEYSHIPVVLLTAKNDLNSKIHGLEMGADAYVEKPFSLNHLQTQLTTLLSNRRREKEAFMRKPFIPIQHMGMNKADEQFMEKVINTIQENITDSNFNVEKLAESVFMSRSSLHRKIKALTELAPTDFIRLIRLKKAAELIQSGEYRVGEVCYLVGINSSSYFIKLFQKQFGMTPKEFEKQHNA
ncbi:response regulator [Dysgonomonas sp. 216]|uniref:two-component regulator propeller domain-containing protein n=1 Tax=Dysgonomonas sp. 216 TaxID=2302934 RepID=UPI0013D1159B|nr:two-component regulator propeller domain-containing protein [Dysgonomonas sp. 216]NDW17615.1 response regulator [Dysgonomonas sp. 216]